MIENKTKSSKDPIYVDEYDDLNGKVWLMKMCFEKFFEKAV